MHPHVRGNQCRHQKENQIEFPVFAPDGQREKTKGVKKQGQACSRLAICGQKLSIEEATYWCCCLRGGSKRVPTAFSWPSFIAMRVNEDARSQLHMLSKLRSGRQSGRHHLIFGFWRWFQKLLCLLVRLVVIDKLLYASTPSFYSSS